MVSVAGGPDDAPQLGRWTRILSFYQCPISTSTLEDINTKIRVLNRRTYGHRDLDFLALRILFIPETRFRVTGALGGTHAIGR